MTVRQLLDDNASVLLVSRRVRRHGVQLYMSFHIKGKSHKFQQFSGGRLPALERIIRLQCTKANKHSCPRKLHISINCSMDKKRPWVQSVLFVIKLDMSENQPLCALVFLTSLFCSACSQGTRFVHSAALDADGRYNIKWGFDESTITFEVHVETKGYIGFGFSPTGAMSSSDIVIGGVLNGSPYLLVSVHASLGLNASHMQCWLYSYEIREHWLTI